MVTVRTSEARLPPEAADHVHHKRDENAENNASHDRKIERRVLTAIEDVARQASDGQVRAPGKDEDSSNHEHEQAKEDKDPA